MLCCAVSLIILSHLGVDLLAYWDQGSCGPDGDNANWEWCDTDRGGNCDPVVMTDKCRSGVATLIDIQGKETSTSYQDLFQFDGCNYAYYARYTCSGKFS